MTETHLGQLKNDRLRVVDLGGYSKEAARNEQDEDCNILLAC